MTNMRIILALVLALSGVSGQQVSAEPAESPPESFLLGASDIPLMPGLAEDEATSFLFDKPGGRIIAARLDGCVATADARHFYGATLPQLGWLPADGGLAGSALTYLREGEQLTIEFADKGDCLELRFLLSPAPGED